MIWRNRSWISLIATVAVLAGCDYKPTKKSYRAESESDISIGPLPDRGRRASVVVEDTKSVGPLELSPEIVQKRKVLIENITKQMQLAADHPGGRNFEMATETLNELFEFGTKPSDYASTPASNDFLLKKIYELTGQDPAPIVKSFSSPKFTIRDARHIEDCMLYRSVALRVAGEGDDLTRVRRIFDWLVRNVMLVPAESLAVGNVRQAQVRPADALFRGMATENGAWSERGWLFMSLCRQINIDVGILTFSPRRPMAMASAPGARPANAAVTWILAAIVDDKPYLFDPRIGLEIPSIDGAGVATINDVINYPEILQRLDLPGESTLGTTGADLAGSPTKIGVLIDSSIGYLSPRMRLLQGQLRGDARAILFRDPAEQAKHFAKALGTRFGGVSLWNLPIQVEDLLFSSPEFVAATQASLQFFDAKYPLLTARTSQLRGDLVDATNRYVALRFAENTEIAPEAQRALDIYATYFLALSHLDQGNTKQAEDLFRKMLNLVPEPGPGRFFYYMLRWGALNNLGRICEAKGDVLGAVAFYSKADETNNFVTPQRHGDLLRIRRLVWNNPITELPDKLPAAPIDPNAPPPSAPTMIAAPKGN